MSAVAPTGCEHPGLCSQLGQMNCSELHGCKAGGFVSTEWCSSSTTDSDEWLRMHGGECMGGQRRVRSSDPKQQFFKCVQVAFCV